MKKLKKIIFLLILVVGYCYINDYYKDYIKDNSNNIEYKKVEKNENSIVDGIFNVYFFDVGQADCIMIQCNDEYMLIDAGNRADGPLIVNYLKNKGIDKFNYVVATHAHEDHIGGMSDVIKNFNIDNFYMSDVVTTTKTFENMLDALEEKEVNVIIPEIDKEFLLGDAKFKVISILNDENDLNDTSIVLKAVYGNNSFLFTGDATDKVEKQILNKDIRSDLLKVGHHGSSYSSTIDFLNKVKPKIAVISVGAGNNYNHPNLSTIKKFESIDCEIYRTDYNHTILASSDGKNITMSSLDISLNG